MTNSEWRLFRVEGDLKKALQQISELQQQIGQLQQNQFAQTPGGGGAGNSGAVYYAVSSSGTWGGTWSGGAPSTAGSITATVYQISGTTVTNLGSQTVRNWFPSSPANSLVMFVVPDGSGGYVVPAQSCT